MPLALPPVHLGDTPRTFWSRFNPFHGELMLRSDSPQDLLDKATRPQDLIRRHGLQRVLAFYDEQLLPALHKQPITPEIWQARITVGCWTVAMRAALEPDRKLLADITNLNAELVQADFVDAGTAAKIDKNRSEQINRETRKQVRIYLAAQLAKTASRFQARSQEPELLEVYQLMEKLGGLNDRQRLTYTRLLWRKQGPQTAVVPMYLRCLQYCRWRDTESEEIPWDVGADNELQAMAQFVAGQMAIGEQTSRQELPLRLFFNQLALRASGSPGVLSQRIGLAYLRLQQPDQALRYLQGARSVTPQTDGANAFYLGQALFQLQKYSAAAAAFKQAREKGYSQSRIASWLGMVYAKNQEYQQAFATFQQAEADLGTIQDSEFFLLWGRVSFLVQQVDDAEKRFKQALALEPAGWRSTLGLAACFAQRGQPQQAIALLEPVVRQANSFAPATYLLGRLLEADNRLPEAVLCYRQALTMQPNDAEYGLMLGLALDELHEIEGLRYLETAAEAGVGGAEVLRRLVYGHFHQGKREQGRVWLEKLFDSNFSAPLLLELHARDQASQAAAHFNAGRYQEAAELWQQAAEVLKNPMLNERLALALLADAAAHLHQGELAGIWEQIERAHALATAIIEARFLYGVARLAQGDFDTAYQQFSDLLAEYPERQDFLLFQVLTVSMAGDSGEAEGLPDLAVLIPTQQSQLACLQVLLAVRKGDIGQAVEQIDTWVEDSNAVYRLPRQPVNRLVALCKLRGTRTKRQRLVQFFEQLNTRYGGGYWDLAVVLVRQGLATAKGLARAGESAVEELQQCQGAYEALLKQASPAERQALLDHYARFLLFAVCHYVQRGELKVALDILDRLQALQTLPPALQRLQQVLRARLAKPSHEKAFTLLTQNPDEARKVWRALLERDRNDLVALHHLACLAWSRAFDQVLAKHHDAAIPFWKEGLEYYRQLYANANYWSQLREKGRDLGQSVAFPFDEPGFEHWQEQAIYRIAQTLVELVFQVLAGKDLAERREADPEILTARSLIAVIRESRLEATTVTRLGDELANHYLDPDPTEVPNFATSRSHQRAERVIDIDPHGVKARVFLVRGTAHQIDTRRHEGNHNCTRMVEELEAIRRHAEWLEKRRRSLAEEQRARIDSDLASYYYQLGQAKHDQGQEETTNCNNYLSEHLMLQARTSLQRIRQYYQDSDKACQKSLEFDRVNPKCRELMEHHQSQYEPIRSNLEDLERVR